MRKNDSAKKALVISIVALITSIFSSLVGAVPIIEDYLKPFTIKVYMNENSRLEDFTINNNVYYDLLIHLDLLNPTKKSGVLEYVSLEFKNSKEKFFVYCSMRLSGSETDLMVYNLPPKTEFLPLMFTPSSASSIVIVCPLRDFDVENNVNSVWDIFLYLGGEDVENPTPNEHACFTYRNNDGSFLPDRYRASIYIASEYPNCQDLFKFD